MTASLDPRTWFTTIAARRRLWAAIVLVGAALTGWLVSLLLYPAPLVERHRQVSLVIGLPAEQAERELAIQGFRVKTRDAREADPVLPAGHVTWQDPPAWVELPEGSMVELTLSGGPAQVTVPDVNLFDLEEARKVIAAAGLVIGGIDSVPADVDRGVVVATRPPEGTPRPPGSRLDLVVSRGPAAVRIPEVAGLPEAVARERIEAAGLRIGLVTVRRSGAGRAGTVLSQRPNAGALLPRGGRVDLEVRDARTP